MKWRELTLDGIIWAINGIAVLSHLWWCSLVRRTITCSMRGCHLGVSISLQKLNVDKCFPLRFRLTFIAVLDQIECPRRQFRIGILESFGFYRMSIFNNGRMYEDRLNRGYDRSLRRWNSHRKLDWRPEAEAGALGHELRGRTQ